VGIQPADLRGWNKRANNYRRPAKDQRISAGIQPADSRGWNKERTITGGQQRISEYLRGYCLQIYAGGIKSRRSPEAGKGSVNICGRYSPQIYAGGIKSERSPEASKRSANICGDTARRFMQVE